MSRHAEGWANSPPRAPHCALLVAFVLLLAGCGGGTHAAHTVSAENSAKTGQSTQNQAAGTAQGTDTSAAAGKGKLVPYEVRTVSMAPNYPLERTVYYDPALIHPRIGDVVIFHTSPGAAHGSCGTPEIGGAPCVYPVPGLTKALAIKRVVGLPGDTIVIREGRVIRNGHPEPEPHTTPCGKEPGCEFPKAVTVPAGYYYVMSDDRQFFNEDSRLLGAIPQGAIVGTVVRK
jgi:signal peptidase I